MATYGEIADAILAQVGYNTTHNLQIIDEDTHLRIDTKTREISNQAGKSTLVQYDHNSERITFDLPRYIETHDVLECNIYIQYNNGTNKGIYEINDLKRGNNDTVTFSWLVSRHVTQFIGSIKFVVTLRCYDVDGNLIYNWSTKVNDSLKVIEGMDNAAESVDITIPTTVTVASTKNYSKYFKGKTMAFIGDSRTWYDNNTYSYNSKAQWSGVKCIGYQQTVKKILELSDYSTYAQSGYNSYSISQSFIINNSELTPDNFDFVFLAGGVNDFVVGNAGLGTLGNRASGYKQTIYGAWETTVETLMSRGFEADQIIMLIPVIAWQRGDYYPLQYAHAKKDVANKYKLPCIDLYHCPEFQLYRGYYFQDDSNNDSQWYLHLNNYGNLLAGQKIADYLLYHYKDDLSYVLKQNYVIDESEMTGGTSSGSSSSSGGVVAYSGVRWLHYMNTSSTGLFEMTDDANYSTTDVVGNDYVVNGTFASSPTYREYINKKTDYNPVFFVFDSSDNSLKIYATDQTSKLTSTQRQYDAGAEKGYSEWFAGTLFRKITSVTVVDNVKPTYALAWFSGMAKVTTFTGLDKIDMSECMNTYMMFNECSSITELDLKTWNCKKLMSCAGMFRGCTNLEHIYVGKNFSLANMGGADSNKTYYDNVFSGSTKLPNYETALADVIE